MDEVEAVPVLGDERHRIALDELVSAVVRLRGDVDPGHVRAEVAVAAGRATDTAERVQDPNALQR
ncbi:hypothetical protein [Actinomadura madurae]|uniref:hypothetical protein n=1 Tax=Actinomadura madurae TaxID=1993 RepID=UPI0020D23F2C|nr:hypothetical protein [Actinomadura madurae]MCP9951417.1 hypothetical protein [Actinomadura madurae]MCP9980646.1 hypothetical protein [Actinomadura madurae]MCQ0007839.1 hypothetical protein [Actinomadura madurae]